MFIYYDAIIKLMPKTRGFTLIELLIAITIIAVLAAIGFVAYTGVLKSGRDSKRQSDLRSIQSALEQYNNDQGYYPVSITIDQPLPKPGSPTPYMNKVPGDPLPPPHANYSYASYNSSGSVCDNSSSNKCVKYCLYADLEGSPSGLSGCAAFGAYDFAVTPP